VVFQGKFIRIHFGTNGKIAGADIETCTSNIHLISFCTFENKLYFIFYILFALHIAYT